MIALQIALLAILTPLALLLSWRAITAPIPTPDQEDPSC